jgi:hypothetical protein
MIPFTSSPIFFCENSSVRQNEPEKEMSGDFEAMHSSSLAEEPAREPQQENFLALPRFQPPLLPLTKAQNRSTSPEMRGGDPSSGITPMTDIGTPVIGIIRQNANSPTPFEPSAITFDEFSYSPESRETILQEFAAIATDESEAHESIRISGSIIAESVHDQIQQSALIPAPIFKPLKMNDMMNTFRQIGISDTGLSQSIRQAGEQGGASIHESIVSAGMSAGRDALQQIRAIAQDGGRSAIMQDFRSIGTNMRSDIISTIQNTSKANSDTTLKQFREKTAEFEREARKIKNTIRRSSRQAENRARREARRSDR